MRTCPMKDGSEVCGRPAFSNSASECEEHFANLWPIAYARLKAEIKCPECGGTGRFMNRETERQEDCRICGARGCVDPRQGQPPTPVSPEMETPLTRKVFDPGVNP